MGRGFLWGLPHPHALPSLEVNHLTPQKRAGLPSVCKDLCRGFCAHQWEGPCCGPLGELVFCSASHRVKSEGWQGWVPCWRFWDKSLLLIQVLAECSSVWL